MINTKSYKIIIKISILIILATSWYLLDTIREYKYTNERYKQQTFVQIIRMRSFIHGADMSLAKTLVSVDNKAQFSSLLDAQKYVASINRNVFVFHNTSYANFWSKSEQYLDYLLTKNELLNNAERENLNIIRHHLNIIIPSFNELDKIAKEKDWVNHFENDERVKKIFNDMIVELEKLPNIGENDDEYKQSKYKYIGYYPRDVFKEENKYSKEELSKFARNFMGELWDSDVDVIQGGGQSGPILGSRIAFNASKNRHLIGSYEVDISEFGGHIISVESLKGYESENDYNYNEDNVLGKITKQEAIDYSKKLIKRWNEEDLELYNLEEKDEKLIMTFVPKRNNISLLNRKVEIIIDPTIGKLQNFDAYHYFSYYGKEAPLEWKLSQEDIINIISNKAKITGTFNLEVISGKSGSDVLTYSVPVIGIDKVKKIYINAVNGKNEGIVYEDHKIN